MEKPIFIIGLPRTGSTLWHNVLAKNEIVCRIGEMHYLTPVRKDFRYFIKKNIGRLNNEKKVRYMFDLIFSGKKIKGLSEGFWTFDIRKVEDDSLKETMIRKVCESDMSLENIFKIITEEYGLYKKKSRICVKFPAYINHIPDLISWFPDCKIIHITRDPRAIAVSRKNDPAGTRKKLEKYPYFSFFIKKIMVMYVVIQYIWTSRLHMSYKKYDNYKLFRYEDLLMEPRKTIMKLCEHTEIDFNEEMLNPGKGQPSSITQKKREGFDKTAAYRWKDHITIFENKSILFFTKPSMKRLGY